MAGTLSPERAALIGAIGGLTTSSRTDGHERTAKARQAAFARFLHDVDPDERLDPEERHRRARALEKAHLARMRLLSAESRRAKKAGEDEVAA
jgi:hypothetical protein